MLADEGVYLASESSFARVLRANGQSRHRGRTKAPHAGRPPTTHIATAPRQVWCWDMTYLPVSPAQRHDGQDQAILAARHALYTEARALNPTRWSGKTRN